jgi:2-oxoglutarate decarboxylase
VATSFGPNAWLVDDMYDRYLVDPSSVAPSWREFFSDYRPAPAADGPDQPWSAPPAASASPAPAAADAAGVSTPLPAAAEAAVAPAVALGPQAAPPEERPAPAPPGALGTPPGGPAPAPNGSAPGEVPVPLRGAAARIVANMEASLGVPTATSVRTVPAKLLEVNRQILNNQLARTTGAKVSFTHLIGYAVVRGLGAVPALNASYVPQVDGGGPGVVRHAHVGLGLAVDVEKPDGSRTLLVPCVKDADTLDFRSFVLAYESLVRKVHSGRAAPDDFAGTTVTLTNPGTLGTVQSVPRLMPGQGAIVGVGALGYPPGYEAADPNVLAELGIGKVVTLTSTYDHRVIQGAESGLFLAHVAECLMGGHGFYADVFESMGVPYEPVRWQVDTQDRDGLTGNDHGRLVKQVHVQALINMYRVRGHLIAHLDPLDAEPPHIHPELDPLTYGLTIWDLPRRFVTDGLAGRDVASLDEILHLLRDAYCRSLGIEYMHIQDPEQKRWIQQHVEGVPATVTAEEQWHVLERLIAAEVFERFLHTRYVGQKRFGLEGAESAIVLLDALLDEAAKAGTAEVVMGMAHRGRLNVLANIVGKSYREIFEEFEGNLDPESVQGSGDVKYHKGAVGTFVGRSGRALPVTLASNPSHLEAVDPVVEGMARAKQDALLPPTDGTPTAARSGTFPVLALLVHGDAAFAGQGVVAETLNLSGLSGYRIGGTVHVVVNNQLGFTTAPEAARTSVYPTDVAKMVQAPIFHVNGDDPEACLRAARLACGFRQAFHKDVVIDLVCYRRHGHNEGDDPSYTQPLMYKRIEAKRSVRKLYTETLVRRGDITLEQAEQSLDEFNDRLQAALDSVRAEAPPPPARLPAAEQAPPAVVSTSTGVPEATLRRLEQLVRSVPEGFTLHPKLGRQFAQRAELFARGEVDWSLAEALAIGSLLLEGVDVRLTGQDTRRGTFSQRHAVLVDYESGREHVPLAHLDGERVGRFTVRDSLLSEYAALGFEYGYSVEAPDALVCWEAQFGDFVNGAEVIIDNFLVAAEEKWGQRAGLTLLLPHGYEGQGPEHSSARVERFLSLGARGNLRVAVPSTAAQYFHLLRSQARRTPAAPLVVITPKSMLRASAARSQIADLVEGGFAPVLDDEVADPPRVRRVVLCSGKLALEALRHRARAVADQPPADAAGGAPSGPAEVAVVRVEQLYPWPQERIVEVIDRYQSATEVVWLQEEPENMGAWSFVHARLHRLLGKRCSLRHVSRAESASPATGSGALHQVEQADLLDRAIG